jgi:formylglycine-generating enzyme required for sulfatase activity
LALPCLILLLASCAGARPARLVERNADWTPEARTIDGVMMVWAPPGCFVMGSDDGRRDERPPHRQCFERGYWIDQTEVTNAQYGSEGAYPGPLRPRGNLTWVEARDFCRQRGARLPTEAEWEYAARGPDSLIYPWGNLLIEQFHNLDKRSDEPAEVGSYPAGASWVGALDMSGNLWEWVSSAYAPYPYQGDDGRERDDAAGNAGNAGNADDADNSVPRVFRGGWLSYVDRGTSAVMRFRMDPEERDWRVGFRCARDDQ